MTLESSGLYSDIHRSGVYRFLSLCQGGRSFAVSVMDDVLRHFPVRRSEPCCGWQLVSVILGYRNTIELPDGNNVVPLRSDTIQLVQNRYSFHGLKSDDPNQHLKDFLKLVDSLEDLAFYDNESWNDTRDFAKPVKAIFWPQDVLSTCDRRLIELENHVQHLMEAHLAHNSSVQVNKISSSCVICNGPHDTQYCMENPKLVSKFMASQDARLSKFEADFKQQQSKMTNKIDTFLKFLPNGRPPKFIPLQTVFEIGTPKPKGPEHALENECKDLHLNLTVLEVLDHAPIYNAFLDKYVESLELGKNGHGGESTIVALCWPLAFGLGG
ncbi:hypothetical protein Tco_0765296 [Tanacetum coccineum]